MNKKAQVMGMPFAVIFSIILIVVFLVVAGIVLKHFLGLAKCSEIGIFMGDFQDRVDAVWKSSSRSEVFNIALPGAIKEICFVDFNKTLNNPKYSEVSRRYSFYNPNFFFYPPEKACEISYYTFKHINVSQAVEANANPFCIENNEGAKIKISKDFYESLVRLEKA
jgi:hypothetical protein